MRRPPPPPAPAARVAPPRLAYLHEQCRRTGSPRLVSAVLAFFAGVITLFVTACGAGAGAGDGGSGSGSGRTSTRASDPGSASRGGTTFTPRASTDGLTPIATGLASPWGLAFLPDGRALVAERDSGRVLLLPAAGGAPSEVTTLPVRHRSEGGLLGLAVSPHQGQGQNAGQGLSVYAYYTSATDNRVVRFQLTGDRATRPADVLTGLRAAPNHNGGRIAFGPDGQLYVAVGDAGEPDTAQDPRSLNGKILRMTPEGRVPADNPDPTSLVYSLGHRNVQGLAWDSAGRLWASEFGQNTFDEINLISPGANYGWPAVEGRGDTAGGRYTNPQVTWSTDEASPSGVAIRDDVLYVAALRGERLWVINLEDGRVSGTPRALFTGELGRLRTIEPAPDGTLWLTTSNTDGRGTPDRDDDRILSLR